MFPSATRISILYFDDSHNHPAALVLLTTDISKALQKCKQDFKGRNKVKEWLKYVFRQAFVLREGAKI